jgi:type VI secretion system protein VasD
MNTTYLSKCATVIAFVIISFTITGCTKAIHSTREVLNFDTSVELEFIASEELNPDADDRPSPLVITVFKLGDDHQFEREDFLNLYEQPRESLGPDLLGMLRLKEIAPGEKRTELLELSPEVHYLGLIAEYTQYERAKATLVLPITSHSSNEYELLLNPLELRLRKD